MQSTIQIFTQYREAFMSGLGVTLELIAIVWIVGIVVGTLLGALADKKRESVGRVIFGLGFVISSIPVLVFLYWAHFPFQTLIGQVIDPFVTAATVLSIVNAFLVSDIVRSALGDFPEEYAIAARVCGLSYRETLLKVKLPIVTRRVIPPLLSTQVVMLQSTLFASLISVEEIFRVAQRVNALAYKPIEIYTALAVFFLAICLPLNGLAIVAKQRLTRDISDR